MNELKEERTPHQKPFTEDEDYYFDNGLLVMTAKFHLRRGYCCGNLCRHCPFEHAAVPQSKRKTLIENDSETAARRSVGE